MHLPLCSSIYILGAQRSLDQLFRPFPLSHPTCIEYQEINPQFLLLTPKMPRLPLPLALLLPLLTVLLASKSKSYNNLGSGVGSFSHPDTSQTEEYVLASPNIRLYSPHGASWRTWFHPRRTGSAGRKGEWNLLYHLGGNGPWVELGEGQAGIEPPEGCIVDQVHMVCSII